jgi:integrase
MANIRKRGPSQYQGRVRVKGYPEASRTFKTKQEALEWAIAHERQLQVGLGESLRKSHETTLAIALERYAAEVSPTKKGHLQELRRIHVWAKQPIAAFSLSKIRGVDIAKIRDARINSGISGDTVRLDLAIISHLYEVARKDWGLETLQNPVKACRKPKAGKGRERRLLLEEEQLLLAHCEKIGKSNLRLALILAVETAMRRSELVRGMKWKDIDLKNRIVHLKDTKNGDGRLVPLSRRAMNR